MNISNWENHKKNETTIFGEENFLSATSTGK